MTPDELRKMVAEATEGPWVPEKDVFWRIYVAEGRDYGGQCVADLLESAAMFRTRAEDEDPDDFSEANARLIAAAPTLALALAEAMEALRAVLDACDQGQMTVAPGRGIGGMTIEANIKGSVYSWVPAWPIECARATLDRIGEMT